MEFSTTTEIILYAVVITVAGLTYKTIKGSGKNGD